MSRRIPGSRRPTKKRKISIFKEEPDYNFHPRETVKPQRQHPNVPKFPSSLRTGATLALPFGVTLAQGHGLPVDTTWKSLTILRQAGSLCQSPSKNNSSSQQQLKVGEDGDAEADWGIDYGIIDEGAFLQHQESPINRHNRHRRRREKQYERWAHDVIPGLIHPFLEYRASTQNGRISEIHPSIVETTEQCHCRNLCQKLVVVVAHWDRGCILPYINRSK